MRADKRSEIPRRNHLPGDCPECVVSTETFVSAGKRLAVAPNTLDFEETNEGTMLKVTIQMVSFVGPGMVEGYKSGNQSALEGLSHYLSDSIR